MKIVLWELRSASDLPVRCTHQHEPPSAHRVTVTVGEIERFSELYRTEADAHDEAAHLLSHFMLKGWIDVAYRDSRIALPSPSDRLVHFAVTKSLGTNGDSESAQCNFSNSSSQHNPDLSTAAAISKVVAPQRFAKRAAPPALSSVNRPRLKAATRPAR